MSYEKEVYNTIERFSRVFVKLVILLFERFYKYGWNESKNLRNIEKHELTLSYGRKIFFDFMRIIYKDERFDYGEIRYLALGEVHGTILSVCFTSRGFFKRRLISVRKASRQERRKYYGKR